MHRGGALVAAPLLLSISASFDQYFSIHSPSVVPIRVGPSRSAVDPNAAAATLSSPHAKGGGMAMIYRRHAHNASAGRLTTTIPPHHAQRHVDEAHPAAAAATYAPRAYLDTITLETDDDKREPDDDAAVVVTRWLCRQPPPRRKHSATTIPGDVLPPPSLAQRVRVISHRVYQTLWLALLVFAFLGVPAIGRIIVFVRYSHRFSAWSIMTGLFAGMLQDIAVFAQASTLIVLIKALFQPYVLQRRSSAATASTSALPGSAAFGLGVLSTTPSTGVAQELYPHSYGGRFVHLPVYLPVRTNEFDQPPSIAASSAPAVSSSSSSSAVTTSSSSSETDPDLETGPATVATTTRSNSISISHSTSSAMATSLPQPSAIAAAPHRTLVASSSLAAMSFPWSHNSAHHHQYSSSTQVALQRVRGLVNRLSAVVLLAVVLFLATVASVADFCLQVTMHPRLNRAFVEIFVNYAEKFTGSLLDEEVLTSTVIVAWSSFAVLIITLTYGFYKERLPLLPDLLTWPSWSWSSSSSSTSGSSSLSGSGFSSSLPHLSDTGIPMSQWCRAWRSRRSYRKNSSTSAATMMSTEGAVLYVKSLVASAWFGGNNKDDADVTLTSSQRPRRRRSSSHTQHSHADDRLPHSAGARGVIVRALRWLTCCCRGNSSGSASSTSSAWMKPKTPLGMVLHCTVVTLFLSLGALLTSLLVHSTTFNTSSASQRHRLSVDMQLMSNAMFSLQTENFFSRKSRLGMDHINCTEASRTLLATLGASELYDTRGIGNTDSCALLWRKTIGFQGETWWDIRWQERNDTLMPVIGVSPNVTTLSTFANASTAATTSSSLASAPNSIEEALRNGTAFASSGSSSNGSATATQASTKMVPRPPNIILINLESWRSLDVGVLGGADKKRKYGKSATPNFDRLSEQGVLYTKHYSPCVQTTRTLLTTLFGMLPSCTETTALKRYGSSLAVRGLPQFLKERGYYNMFWSAVDLSWEYWDIFLRFNGFDKLVDDKKVRRMLHEVRQYKDRDDDHFSWGMHDHLSFEMLLHALEFAKKNQDGQLDDAMTPSPSSELNSLANATTTMSDSSTASAVRPSVNVPGPMPSKRHADTENHSVSSKPQTSAQRTSAAATSSSSTSSTARPSRRRTVGWEGLREPYFIDMYTISSHNPWILPHDYSVPDLSELYTPFNKRYIDAVYFTDDMLGQFIDNMRAKGLMNNTIVIIEGDHGYGRLEHDNNPSIADSAVFDEAAYVPFLILADDYLKPELRGMEIEQLTMQTDVLATIADVLGVSPEEPLLQHGVGHSMRRRRRRTARQRLEDLDYELIAEEPLEEASHVPPTERRALLCNPFNGMTKGVRTEELKYVFNPDGSFRVFELKKDPEERRPVRSGYDIEQMDKDTRAMFDYANTHLDLNQFLYETNKFLTPLLPTHPPPKKATASRFTQEADPLETTRVAQRPTQVPQKSDEQATNSEQGVR
ncbi:hypothetical protein PINS_up016047 [Pythium insidiosum]|nr:hypothetical protein PINS_up016047 [Pythium insidiosum]